MQLKLNKTYILLVHIIWYAVCIVVRLHPLPSSFDELIYVMRKRCVIADWFVPSSNFNKHLLDVRLFTIAELPEGII